MYGTVMIATCKGSPDDLRQAIKDWESDGAAPGFVGQDMMIGEDGTAVGVVRFESREAYQKLADDPSQDTWWSTRMAPLLGDDVRWVDGEWELGNR
jgi:hypothetical protein